MTSVTVKTKIQKVFLRGENLSREQARKIQKTVNDYIAGKQVDLYAALPTRIPLPKTAVPVKPVSYSKYKADVTYSGGAEDRTYYADGSTLAVVRESNSRPGTYRFKVYHSVFGNVTVPFARELGFKTFNQANKAALAYLSKHLSFKTPKKANG